MDTYWNIYFYKHLFPSDISRQSDDKLTRFPFDQGCLLLTPPSSRTRRKSDLPAPRLAKHPQTQPLQHEVSVLRCMERSRPKT